MLTVAAAAAGAAAAILAGVAARLTGDPRPSWIAAALVLYCLIVLPWSTVAAVELDVVHRASRLVAYLGALVLLLLAIRPPRILRAWGGWALLLATGLLALVVLGLPESAAMRWLVDGPVLTVAVLSGWTAAAAVFVADGFRRRSRPRIRLGLGLVVLAVGQLYRVAAAPTAPSSNLVFGGLRLARAPDRAASRWPSWPCSPCGRSRAPSGDSRKSWRRPRCTWVEPRKRRRSVTTSSATAWRASRASPTSFPTTRTRRTTSG